MPGPKIRIKEKTRSISQPPDNVHLGRIKFRQRGTQGIRQKNIEFQKFQKWEKLKLSPNRPSGQFRKLRSRLVPTRPGKISPRPVAKPKTHLAPTHAKSAMPWSLKTFLSQMPLPVFAGPMMLMMGFLFRGAVDKSLRIQKVLQNAPTGYASQLHNVWRQSRTLSPGELAVDGLPMREPRWKEVKPDDSAYQKAPGKFRRIRQEGEKSVYEVDIANLDFNRLPEKFQYENAEAAKGVVAIVQAAMAKQPGQKEVVIDLEAASAIVHKQWLDRNGSWAPEHQKLPYEKLSEAEKEKDREVLLGGIYFLNQKLKDEGVQIVTRAFIEAKTKNEGVKSLDLEEFYTVLKIYQYWGLVERLLSPN